MVPLESVLHKSQAHLFNRISTRHVACLSKIKVTLCGKSSPADSRSRDMIGHDVTTTGGASSVHQTIWSVIKIKLNGVQNNSHGIASRGIGRLHAGWITMEQINSHVIGVARISTTTSFTYRRRLMASVVQVVKTQHRRWFHFNDWSTVCWLNVPCKTPIYSFVCSEAFSFRSV